MTHTNQSESSILVTLLTLTTLLTGTTGTVPTEEEEAEGTVEEAVTVVVTGVDTVAGTVEDKVCEDSLSSN